MTPRSTTRRVAGAPVTGTVFKCQTKSVLEAIADGDYGTWSPDAAQLDRLFRIFPSGVCDYSRPDLGDPRTVEAMPPNEVFARQAYVDLVGTSIPPEHLAFLRERFAAGWTRTQAARNLVETGSFHGRMVNEAYQQVLGRDADPAGSTYWAQRLALGLTRTALIANLLNSGEAYARGGSTPAGFVDLVYSVLLGRPADAAGRAHWVAALDGGVARWVMARAILGSTEARRLRVTGAVHGLPRPGARSRPASPTGPSSSAAATTSTCSSPWWRAPSTSPGPRRRAASTTVPPGTGPRSRGRAQPQRRPPPMAALARGCRGLTRLTLIAIMANSVSRIDGVRPETRSTP